MAQIDQSGTVPKALGDFVADVELSLKHTPNEDGSEKQKTPIGVCHPIRITAKPDFEDGNCNCAQ